MIIKIVFGDKEVSFSTAYAWALRYSAQFHRDAMKDLAPALGGSISDLSMDTVARIAWAAAALCDPKIEPDLEKWVQSLGDDFTYYDIANDVVAPIIEASLTSKKSQAPAAMAAGAKK